MTVFQLSFITRAGWYDLSESNYRKCHGELLIVCLISDIVSHHEIVIESKEDINIPFAS